MVDILLVNPNSRINSYGALADELAAIEPPFWAGLMADDFKKKGKEVAILDAEAEGFDFAQTVSRIKEIGAGQNILVAMGVNPSASSTPKMTVVDAIYKILAFHGTPTFITGLHPMALPDIRTKFWHPHQGLSVPWELLPMEKYRAHNWHCFGGIPRSPYATVYTSFGCPYSCSYCNIHTLYDTPKVQSRDLSEVLAEVDLLVNRYGVKNIKIMDELFTVNRYNVMQICDGLIERNYGLNIWVYARVDTVSTQMLDKMKRAGMNWLGIGFESAVLAVREAVGKKYMDFEQEATIRQIRDAGIHIAANIIFGLPDDSLATMQRTLDWVEAHNFEYVNFYCATAYPGSELYKQQANPSQDWNTYAQLSSEFVPLPTKYLSSAEILAFRDNAFRHYFSRPAYLTMMERKFGDKAVADIRRMLERKMERSLLR